MSGLTRKRKAGGGLQNRANRYKGALLVLMLMWTTAYLRENEQSDAEDLSFSVVARTLKFKDDDKIVESICFRDPHTKRAMQSSIIGRC